jgi:hypothetical protein
MTMMKKYFQIFFSSLTRGGKPGRPKWYMEGFRRSRRASPAAPLKKRKDRGGKWKMRTTGKIKGCDFLARVFGSWYVSSQMSLVLARRRAAYGLIH